MDDLEIIVNFRGVNDWEKFSFPVSYGLLSKIKWKGYEFDFNLKGNLKRITGNASVWPSPLEQLKRTDGNDLLYYGAYGYEATYDLIKNYYVPYNGINDSQVFTDKPFNNPQVINALDTFTCLVDRAGEIAGGTKTEEAKKFLRKVASRDLEALAREGKKLHEIMGGDLPVLPPDTLNVDYEVIPLMVMNGCSHQCDFCRFKRDKECRIRDEENISKQIRALKEFYGDDLINYNSLVLGENNALVAGAETIEYAARRAYEILDLGKSYHRGDANLFLFGSADLFLEAGESFFTRLSALPYNTFLNIGLESCDHDTLNMIGKSLTADAAYSTFQRALHVNDTYNKVEITCNFILGRNLPPGHMERLKNLLAGIGRRRNKGTIYLSPLRGASERRQVLQEFREIKRASLLPVFLYLMQRL